MKSLTTKLLALTFAVACSTTAMADMTASDVLNLMHQTNRMEIHMGMLAQEQSSTDDVKAYGKTLESDHKENDDKVVAMAAKDGITLKSAKPGVMDKMEMKALKEKTGSDFDKAFAKKMIDGHKDKIEKLESAQKSALPEDVRTLVGDTLPTLQKHLEIAQKIYGQPS